MVYTEFSQLATHSTHAHIVTTFTTHILRNGLSLNLKKIVTHIPLLSDRQTPSGVCMFQWCVLRISVVQDQFQPPVWTESLGESERL